MIARIEQRGLLGRWYVVLRNAGELGPFWLRGNAEAVRDALDSIEESAWSEGWDSGCAQGKAYGNWPSPSFVFWRSFFDGFAEGERWGYAQGLRDAEPHRDESGRFAKRA